MKKYLYSLTLIYQHKYTIQINKKEMLLAWDSLNVSIIRLVFCKHLTEKSYVLNIEEKNIVLIRYIYTTLCNKSIKYFKLLQKKKRTKLNSKQYNFGNQY